MTLLPLPRRHIRRLSACLVAVLLLTQLATVAFACAVEQAPQEAPQEAAVVQFMADMPGCPEMAAVPAPVVVQDVSLCHAHCDQGSQVTSASLALDLSGSASIQSGLRVSGELEQDLIAGIDPRDSLEVPTTGWPPPYLTFLVLRN